MLGRSLGILACAGVGLTCSPHSGPSGTGSGGPPKPTFTLFALAEVRGQIEPCGCTTDPLGDIGRTTRLIADARSKGPVIVVDAGSLLYSKAPVPPHLLAQERLKAALLVRIYREQLDVDAIGVGPMDLADAVEPGLPRQVANYDENNPGSAPPPFAIDRPRVIEAGTAKVGVFGVVALGLLPDVMLLDPIARGIRAREELRGKGAQLVVALVHAASKRDALQIVRRIGGIDVAVLGLGMEAPEPDKVPMRAEDVDGTWVVIPANRGQVVSRLDVTIRSGGGPLVDAIGPAAAATTGADLEQQIARLDEDLAAFAKDPAADPAFVEATQKERAELAGKRERLAQKPLRIPATGSWFTLDQVRITKKLACDAAVNAAKTAYDRAAGEANLAAARQRPQAPVKKGTPTYAGTAACKECHADQVELWATTRHAHAWATLEDRGKQLDFDCIGCHVTGWDKPGGATLAENAALRDVQCETCHGPGSIHIAKDGDDGTIAGAPDPGLCASQCHTPEHSDTFNYEAYLRDIVGPGHGADRRTALGDGPTGRQLRAAGLAKAGAAIGEGCTK